MGAEATVLLAGRLCLGLFFLISAVGKITHQRNFIAGVVNYRILPVRAARVFGYALPWIECGLALALLLGIALPLTGPATAVLLIAFILAVAVNLRRGHLIECNCHGIAGTKTISGGTLMRNGLLLLLACAVSVTDLHMRGAGLRSSSSSGIRSLLSSGTEALVVLFLIAFGFITISLLEWATDITMRISRLEA